MKATDPFFHRLSYERSYLIQGLIGALAINLVLFGLLSGLVGMDSGPKDLESLNVVNFTRFTPQPPAPKEKNRPEPEKPDKPPEKIHQAARPRHQQIPQQQLRLDMPALDLNIDLDIDPRISGGVPMVAQPETPVNSAPVTDIDGILDQSAVDVVPMPTFKKAPRYPYRAKRMGLEGNVKISFIVDKLGRVSDIAILASEPPGVFDDAVRKAVASWKYAPGELMGHRVLTRVTTSVVFKLE